MSPLGRKTAPSASSSWALTSITSTASAREILDWAFASFSDRQLTDTQTVLTTVPLTKCRNEETVELYAEPVSGYGHADDPITYSFEVPESVSATVKYNAVIGSATVYLDGYEIGTVDLVTHQEHISDFAPTSKPRWSFWRPSSSS